MKHRPRSLRSFGLLTFCLAATALVGCANSESDDGEGGSGGTTASGKGGSTGGGDTGGTTAKGGTTGAAGTNGIAGTTGTAGTTGRAGTSGTTGIAGTTGTGTGTAGTTGRAGTTGTTGIAGTTGTGTGTAGTTGRAGTTGTAGTNGIAGTTGRAGTTGTGTAGTTGRAGTSGTAGTTGAAGTTGTGTGGAAACTAGTTPTGGKTVTGSGTADGGYTYNFYTNGQGSASMTVYGVNAEFSATWSSPGDFLARVGLGFNSTQTPSEIGTITATFAETKTGTGGGYNYIGIYGWSENPLHEYYIVDDWFGNGPPNPGGTKVGQITVDGGTYNVYMHTQTNQPSITGGNATFVQFFSVRTSPRSCGTISISQHFADWAAMSTPLQLGNLEEARIVVEVGGGSGSGNIVFTTATVTKS
jgi:endo-1,4-beta-xylanase